MNNHPSLDLRPLIMLGYEQKTPKTEPVKPQVTEVSPIHQSRSFEIVL